LLNFLIVLLKNFIYSTESQICNILESSPDHTHTHTHTHTRARARARTMYNLYAINYSTDLMRNIFIQLPLSCSEINNRTTEPAD